MAVKFKEIDENEVDISVEEFAKRLNLKIENKGSKKMHISTYNIARPGLQFAGYYEHFSDDRVQVVGEQEMSFLSHMTHEERVVSCENFCKHNFPCIVVTTLLEPVKELVDAAIKYKKTLLSSGLRTTSFINEMSIFLNELLAPSITIHGVLVDLYGVGVLIIGNTSVGKSETALELIQRGHRLVADDAVCLKRINDMIIGNSPSTIRHFMEIRGLGIIDIHTLYGSGSIRTSKVVDFVACLETWDDKKEYDRLGDQEMTYNILEIEIPEYVIPVRPGRNLASVLEVAARNFRAKAMGYNALEELNVRMMQNNHNSENNND